MTLRMIRLYWLDLGGLSVVEGSEGSVQRRKRKSLVKVGGGDWTRTSDSADMSRVL